MRVHSEPDRPIIARLFVMGGTNAQLPIGRLVSLPGHFDHPVTLESARPLSKGFECRVRLHDGTLDEAVISEQEAAVLVVSAPDTDRKTPLASADQVRLLIESARIRLAYAHDRQFAVSLSGIRTLPHQIEAVYIKMLPQPRLRFLLADDPGAGKTIMAGLLVKEMKLREAIDRVLILCPSPLTIQWQDELLRWFGESFDIIFSAVDQQQLTNPWQRSSQVIASLDYAKQDEVRERVWQQRWDLVIIDEAHKCSAYTKRSAGRGDEAEKTKRYQLAEQLTAQANHVLLLTATPHHGDDDRFAHFVRLIDPDLFPEPHRMAAKAGEIRREILQLGPDCPWALRRLKEDLRDVNGRRLFPDRHAHSIAFKLNHDEYDLYKTVTAYINEFLPQASGRRKASVALARTVLQRRLASSTTAIFESLKRRLAKQGNLLEELESLPPSQRARRLAQLQGRIVDDAEQDEDDLNEIERDQLADDFTTAAELDQLRSEIAALKELVAQAGRVRERADQGGDSKLTALRECLTRAEFNELKDARGRLLIFTEHRDTLNQLRHHLEKWGFTVCEIHGGMNPYERKRAQEQFRNACQICVATEAAGEGINLQFCRLMINYDLPWNPTRLEQRLGRIHRIGQERDVHAFNFVAAESEDGQPVIEGRILQRLLEKLEQMRAVLADRVFDVVGEVLSLNAVNLPEMLRDAANDPRRLGEYLDRIARVDPQLLLQYEQATGVALARASVDFSAFQTANVEAEERRLMPKYVEDQFLKASDEVGLRVESRADGLWRVEHVLADLRSDRLASVRHVGKPQPEYLKVTFRKTDLEKLEHGNAELVGPGHPLYAVVDERLNEKLAPLLGSVSVFVDRHAPSPYRLHFFELSIRGQDSKAEPVTLFGEVVAVREDQPSTLNSQPSIFEIVSADCLLDLPAHPSPPSSLPPLDIKPAEDFLKGTHQTERRQECQQERQHFVQVCRKYLTSSYEARQRAAQDRVMALRQREQLGASEVALARQRAENDLQDLDRSHKERLASLDRLSIARHGPVRHLASAMVVPLAHQMGEGLGVRAEDFFDELDPATKRKIELAAEDVVIAHETGRGWECTRVGHEKIGFDIRSQGPADSQTGYRDPVIGIRRIEVKGRKRGQPIRLTWNEWNKAQQLGDSYWLYVVWNPLDNPDPTPLMIQNPAKHLEHAAKPVVTARYYDIPAEAVESIHRAQKGTKS